ncbi:MAG: EAL domain-containing protein [Thiobacillaceae bacterium]
MKRLLARLPLTTRLQAALLAVFVAVLFAGGLAARDAARQVGQQALAQMARLAADGVSLLVTEPLILGDLNTAQQLLQGAADKGQFTHVRLIVNGATLAARSTLVSPSRPNWFASLLGLAPARVAHSVSVGGRTYGELELVLSPAEVEARLWLLFWRIGLTLFASSVLLAALIAWIMRANLRGLIRIRQAADGPVEAHLDERIVLSPAAPPELRTVAESLNDAWARIREHVESLKSERERWRVTLESIGDAVLVTDGDGSVRYLNPAAEALTGWREDEAKGLAVERVLSLVLEGDDRPLENPLRLALRTGMSQRLATNVVLVRRDGRQIPVQDSAAPIIVGAGELCGAVLVLRDDSERRAFLAELRHMAFHDPLTGLPNRRALEGRLTRALKQLASEPQRQHVFCYLDLDQFKLVNDTCGHAAGDLLLNEIAGVMQALLPTRAPGEDQPMLARLGGDEFGLLLFDTDVAQAADIASRMIEAIRAHAFQHAGRDFRLGASAGLCPLSPGDSASSVLARADSACYLAKRRGRNRVEVWRPEHADLKAQSEEMEWVGRLESYLSEGRIRLWRQRMVPLAARDAGAHYEILLRVTDAGGEVGSPVGLLTAAERYGLAPSLDRWVLRQLLAYLERHPEDQARYGVNLSGQTISDPLFSAAVRDAFVASGIDPKRIDFELTETAVVNDIATAQRFIDAVHELGCSFTLDDFGAGLSSFAYLKRFKPDRLKIDGSFVRNLDDEPLDYVIVNAIAQIGRDFAIETVAEFVEHAGILERLTEIGVDYVQGYHLHRPEPLV